MNVALHAGAHVLVLDESADGANVIPLPPPVFVPADELSNLDGTPRNEQKKKAAADERKAGDDG